MEETAAASVAPARGSLWFTGKGPPVNMGGERANDLYLDLTSGDVYARAPGAWVKVGNIRGATGFQGAPGPQGPAGPPGPQGPPGGSPPPSGIPAIPASVPGFTITRTLKFAGLTGLPSNCYLYGGQPGGDPVGWWDAAHAVFGPNYLSLNVSGPTVLPDDQTGYISAGIGCTESQVNGRTDVCVRFPAGGLGMSQIALLWPDTGWPVNGEDDFVETGGGSIFGGFNATSHWGAADNNPQVHTPALSGFDWTAWHVWSIVSSTGLRVYLVDGNEWGRITNSNLPDTSKSLRFQHQFLGNGTPTPPCPFDIAWAQQYA